MCILWLSPALQCNLSRNLSRNPPENDVTSSWSTSPCYTLYHEQISAKQDASTAAESRTNSQLSETAEVTVQQEFSPSNRVSHDAILALVTPPSTKWRIKLNDKLHCITGLKPSSASTETTTKINNVCHKTLVVSCSRSQV